MSTPDKITAYNVGPRPNRDILRSVGQLMRDRHSDLTVLFEASDPMLVAALKVRYFHKRVVCHRTDTVAIFSRRGPQPRIEVVGHGTPWTGPKTGKAKYGRSWLLLVWDDVAILPIHRVTPIGNEEAWEADRRVIRTVVRRTDLPTRLAIPGDHNGTDERLQAEYPQLGLRLLPAEAKVDQCAVRKFTGWGVRAGNYGSDHVAMVWHLE